MTKRKKNARERRALVGALCTAAVIVAGSTFAWFTSSDEVTNRLSASADYSVTIAESFKPTDELTPGQKVNKDVTVVNTGNVDAFVRLWLDNKLDLKIYGSAGEFGTAETTVYTPTGVDDAEYTSRAESWWDGFIANYWDTTANEGTGDYITPDGGDKYTLASVVSALTTSNIGTSEDYSGKTVLNDVKTVAVERKAAALKAADGTAYTLTDFNFSIDAEDLAKAVKLSTVSHVDSNGKTVADEVTTLQAGGTLVVAGNKSLPPSKQLVLSGTNGDYVKYTPDAGAGLYIFRRAVNDTSAIYSGYYYDGSGNYYALTTDGNGAKVAGTITSTDDIVTTLAGVGVKTLTDADDATEVAEVKFGAITKGTDGSITGFTANDQALATINSASTTGIAVTYKGVDQTVGDVATKYKVKNVTGAGTGEGAKAVGDEITVEAYNAIADATRPASGSGSNDPLGKYKSDYEAVTATDDIVFYIELASNWSDEWVYYATTDDNVKVANNAVGYFYLKDDLEAGKASGKLIDSVTLSKDVTQESFGEMTYDLVANVQSVQVTVDENGKETTKAVAEAWSLTEDTVPLVPAWTGDEITTAFVYAK